MFKRNLRTLSEEQQRLLVKLDGLEPETEEYKVVLERLKVLCELVNQELEARKKGDFGLKVANTVIKGAGTLGTLVILGVGLDYENQGNIFTSDILKNMMRNVGKKPE